MLEEPQEVEKLDLLDTLRTPQLRSLLMENLSDRFMRQVAFALFQRIRQSVQLLSCITGVISHEAALSQLPYVMLAGIADLTPLRGRMLLAIDGDLIGAAVDAMCGATTAHPFEREELSALEIRIGKQMIDLAFATIAETLAALMPLELKPIAYENANGMLAIADGQDWMIAVTGIFDTALGTGTIKLVVPYAGFEPLEDKFSSFSGMIGGHGIDAGWAEAVEALVEQTPIDLSVDLARAQVPLAVFEALQPGMVLPFFIPEEAIIVAGGVDLLRAEYGQEDGFVCCRVKAERMIEGNQAMGEQTGRTEDTERTERTRDLPGGVGEGERVELEKLQRQPRGVPAISGRNVLDRVQVALTVELGRTRVTVKDLRQLRHGQVVSLDQMVGEPLTIYANGQKLAFGEVVAVANDRYGVRVTALAEDGDADGEQA